MVLIVIIYIRIITTLIFTSKVPFVLVYLLTQWLIIIHSKFKHDKAKAKLFGEIVV